MKAVYVQIWLQSTNGYSILRMYINTLQLFYCWLSYIEASIFLSDANQGEKVLNDTLLQKIKEFRTHIRSQWGGKSHAGELYSYGLYNV